MDGDGIRLHPLPGLLVQARLLVADVGGPRRLGRGPDALRQQLLDHPARVADDPDVDGPVTADMDSIDIDLDDLGSAGKLAPEPHPEVPVHAEREDEIGLSHRGLAGRGEEVGMIRRETAPAEGVQEDGNLHRLGERGERLVGLRPTDPGAGEHDRVLGLGQQTDGTLHELGIALRPGRGAVPLGDLVAHGPVVELDVKGDIEEDRSHAARRRLTEGLGHVIGDASRLPTCSCPLRHRAHQRDVVHVLQGAHLELAER
jgi:hypothetical protein